MVRRRKDKPEKLVKYRHEEIVWEDHHANGAWQSEPDHKPSICYSCGWVWKEDKKGVTLVGSVSPGGGAEHGNTQFIIKKCIVKRRITD